MSCSLATAKRAEVRKQPSVSPPPHLSARSTQSFSSKTSAGTPRGVVTTPRRTRRSPSAQAALRNATYGNANPAQSSTFRNPGGNLRASFPSRLSPRGERSKDSLMASSRSCKGDAAAPRGDACAGQPMQIGSVTGGTGGSGGTSALGLDIANLARKASPGSKHRLEHIFLQLSEELSRIALSCPGEEEERMAPLASLPPAAGKISPRESPSLSEAGEEADNQSTATSMTNPLLSYRSTELGIVERLCDRVEGMRSALESGRRVDEEAGHGPGALGEHAASGSSDAASHQLSQLEKLICSLQSKVEATLPRMEVYDQVRQDQLRMETTELEQQKQCLEAEILRLQHHKEEIVATKGSSQPPPPAAPRGGKPPVVPPLHLSSMRETAGPPHSGRAEQSPFAAAHNLPVQSASLQLPVGGGYKASNLTPRTVQMPMGGAAQEAAAAASAAAVCAVQQTPVVSHRMGTGSTARLAISPRPYRVANMPVMAHQVPIAPILSQRAATPGMQQRSVVTETAPGQCLWAYQPVMGAIPFGARNAS